MKLQKFPSLWRRNNQKNFNMEKFTIPLDRFMLNTIHNNIFLQVLFFLNFNNHIWEFHFYKTWLSFFVYLFQITFFYFLDKSEDIVPFLRGGYFSAILVIPSLYTGSSGQGFLKMVRNPFP